MSRKNREPASAPLAPSAPPPVAEPTAAETSPPDESIAALEQPPLEQPPRPRSAEDLRDAIAVRRALRAELAAQVEEAQRRIVDVDADLGALEAELEALTPRPSLKEQLDAVTARELEQRLAAAAAGGDPRSPIDRALSRRRARRPAYPLLGGSQ